MVDMLTRYDPNSISTITEGAAPVGGAMAGGAAGGFGIDLNGLLRYRAALAEQKRQDELKRQAFEQNQAHERLLMEKDAVKRSVYDRERARADAEKVATQQHTEALWDSQPHSILKQGGFNRPDLYEPDLVTDGANRMRYAMRTGKDLNGNLASTSVGFGDIQGTEAERVAARARQRQGPNGQPMATSWSDRADAGGWGQGY